MYNWLVFALIAPALYASVNFIDKYLLSKEIKDYRALPIYTGIFGFIAGLLFWIFTGFPILHTKDALIVLTTGVITSLSLVVYAKALSKEETSNIIILFQMFPIVTLLLSFLFLKETITLKQLIGFVLIFASAISISMKSKNKFSLSPAFFLILLYDFLWASSAVLIKYTSNFMSFSKIVSYESFGVGLGGILIFIFSSGIRKAFLKNVKRIRIKALGVIALNEGVFVLAKSLTFFAVSLGPTALVSILENTQTFYGILFGWILTLLAPAIFKEDVSKKGLAKKIIFTFVLLVGVWLIY